MLIISMVFCFLCFYYSAGFGESVGHTSAQAPQSIHSSASITYMLSPSEIQLVGHSGSQAPQLIQSSFIKYAISKHLRKWDCQDC